MQILVRQPQGDLVKLAGTLQQGDFVNEGLEAREGVAHEGELIMDTDQLHGLL